MYYCLLPSNGLMFSLMLEFFSDKLPKFVYYTTAPRTHNKNVMPKKHNITMNPGLN